MMLAAQLEESH